MHVFCPLSFDICASVAQPGSYAPASIAPRVTGARDPLHDEALVLREAVRLYLMNHSHMHKAFCVQLETSQSLQNCATSRSVMQTSV
jgi:hypothetical protein